MFGNRRRHWIVPQALIDINEKVAKERIQLNKAEENLEAFLEYEDRLVNDRKS